VAREAARVVVLEICASAHQEFADAGAVEMKGGRGDVARTAALDVDDVLADVGFKDIAASIAEMVGEADFLGDHRLRLGDPFRLTEETVDEGEGIGRGVDTMVVNAPPFEVDAQLLVKGLEVVDAVLAGGAGANAGVGGTVAEGA